MHWFLLRWIEFQSTLPHGSACRRMSNYNMCENFNPRSLKGATWLSRRRQDWLQYFNPRSLAGATECQRQQYHAQFISIHAPSRERLFLCAYFLRVLAFQSTLPHGSDTKQNNMIMRTIDFNPRSLTGATVKILYGVKYSKFQSTLPHGSDG